MPAYALAHLSNVDLDAEVARYIETIDETLVPFEGRFLVHGKKPEVIEGEWADWTVIIGFPDAERAHAWYDSPAYQAILPLHTENSDGATIIVEGVDEGYRAASLLAQ